MDNANHGSSRAAQMVDQTLANRVIYRGASRTTCVDCEEPIPQRRRELIAGCTRCTSCQQDHDTRSRR